MHFVPCRIVALATLTLAGWAGAQTAAPDAIASATSSAPDSTQAIGAPALVAALRQGGHVVYFRHVATDFSRTDEGMKGYGDCDRQRLLSAQGRSDARAVGKHIRALRLPVGEVLASPYCRTMDTARLMFGTAQPRDEIREAQAGDYPGLKRLLAAPVAPGTNRWVVGHGIPFRAIAGAPHLAEGEAAVLRPRGTGWTVVARVPVDEWARLAAGAR
jgi:broad specificity phosphatase PhoE